MVASGILKKSMNFLTTGSGMFAPQEKGLIQGEASWSGRLAFADSAMTKRKNSACQRNVRLVGKGKARCAEGIDIMIRSTQPREN